MRFVDFFSGIGGFRLGMEQAGHECLGHCEIDKFANISYAAIHQPKESEFFATDIRSIEPGQLPNADCYCGGFPCQSFSIAGKRGGFDDTRGTLFFEVMRLAQVRKPRILFLENVEGLLNHDNGRTFETIIRTMDELGYDAEWQVFNSKNFGVPQNRERVFIIGHLRGTSGREVFPIFGANSETVAKDITDGADIAHSLDANYKNQHPNDHGSRTMVVKQIGNFMPTKTRDNPNQGRVYDTSGIAPRLTKMDGGGREPYVIIGKDGRETQQLCKLDKPFVDGKFMSMNGSATGIKDIGAETAGTITARYYKGLGANGDNAVIVQPVLTPDRQEKRQNGRRFKDDGEEMFTLTAQDRHGAAISYDLKAPQSTTRRGAIKNERTGALDTQCNIGVSQNAHIRRLTPRECFRLQGFPDWAYDRAKTAGVSDSQLYKQAGNSVTVNVIYEIAKRL
jgi:DNA (cytosine-5)-methyltransferase 1